MFERFSDRARHVVILTQEEARTLQHNYIGTEHILLGLVQSRGIAAEILASMGVALDAVRSQVEEIIGLGQAVPAGHIPFTPHAKEVLQLSLREARELGHPFVGPEHILLGLIRLDEGVGVQILRRLGAPLSDIRQSVLSPLGSKTQLPPGVPAPTDIEGVLLDQGNEAESVVEFARRGLGDVEYVVEILRASAFDEANDPRHRKLLEGLTDALSAAVNEFYEASSAVAYQVPVYVSWGDSTFDDVPGFDNPLISKGHDLVVAAFADDPESLIEVSESGPDGMPKRYPAKELITWEWLDAAGEPRRGEPQPPAT